jgi:hypothetical protein
LIAEPSCKLKLRTNGVPWPNVVNLSYPYNRSSDDSFHALFEVDWESVKRSEDEALRQGYKSATDQLFETFTGLMVSFDNIEEVVSPPKFAVPRGRTSGFGPAGLDAPAQPLIKSEGGVVVVRKPQK